MKKNFSIQLRMWLAEIFTVICLLLLCKSIQGQVPTVVLNGASIENYIPFYSEKPLPSFILPEVDVTATLQEDIKNGNECPRFGVKIPTNLEKSDGEVENIGNIVIWRKSFYAHDAKSLNFEFESLKLPIGSQIYIYNRTGSMFSGPIENVNVYEGKYSSDIIRGNEVIVEAIIPNGGYKLFEIKISNVIFGFRNMGPSQVANDQSRDYGDALDCEIDINCSEGGLWEDQGDAVALILVNNDRWCSGTLINSTCEELEGFFLTA